MLRAAKNLGVGRVVITSSISSMSTSASPSSLADLSEDSWVDEDYCRQNGVCLVIYDSVGAPAPSFCFYADFN